jgi:mRNA deadenylase 3'-5' endonuclease subunit Ccr4
MAFTQRIVTWNVLSSALSSPKTFVQSDPKYLDANYRLKLVLPRLLSVTRLGSV